MSKTTALIIIVVALVLIFGGVTVWYFNVSGFSSNGGSATSTETGISRFFPFGGGSNQGQNNDNNENQNPINNGEGETPTGEIPQIREISSSPVSGFSTAWGGIDGPLVRFVDQETGNVYEAPLNVAVKNRISNQTIPRVRETVWFPGGGGFIARYLNDEEEIESFSAIIKKATSTEEEGTLSGRFLVKNIFNISIVDKRSATTSRSQTRIIYAIKDGNTKIYSSNADGTNSRNIANIDVSEINITPLSETNIFVQTKPSASSEGSLLLLNTGTGNLSRVVGPSTALNSLPNESGDLILFNSNTNGIPNLQIHNRDSGESFALGIQGFVDKCAWSIFNKNKVFCAIPNIIERGLKYPDEWYQGKVSFSDSIFEIDVSDIDGIKTRRIIDSNTARLFIDTDLLLPSDDDKFILLRDKHTKSLWSVKI